MIEKEIYSDYQRISYVFITFEAEAFLIKHEHAQFFKIRVREG